MSERLVSSMKSVDFSDMKLPVIVVYDHPADYPDSYVARVWEGKGNVPTNTFIKRETLQEIRKDISSAGFWMCLAKNADDDPVIVETWM